MKPLSKWMSAVAFGVLLAASSASHASIYEFRFKANPDALDAAPDQTLDVLHTVTIDDSKVPSFSYKTLNDTSTWLSGGITDAMTYGDKTVTLNSGFDPLLPHPVIHGASYDEGFLSLTPYVYNSGFFALEFAPDSPFVVGNNLPYDPFVYGFLFAYQDDQAFKDFRALWAGDTSVLSSYLVSSVPEPGSPITMLLGLGAIGLLARRKRASL